MTDSVSFQYTSDIHLEFLNDGFCDFHEIVKPGIASYLILAGDIGDPRTEIFRKFIQWCSTHWDKVFYVPGNHEYFGSSIQETWLVLEGFLSMHTNVHWLSAEMEGRGYVDIDNSDLTIVGCTLWTDVPDEDKIDVMYFISDYRKIWSGPEKRQKITPWHKSRWHWIAREYLKGEISRCVSRGRRLIVVSHHLPSMQLIHPKYAGHFLNSSYASSCDDLLAPPIVAWFYGHSHDRNRTFIKDVECLINAHGYPGEFGDRPIDSIAVWTYSDTV